jgi:hypothetical protein
MSGATLNTVFGEIDVVQLEAWAGSGAIRFVMGESHADLDTPAVKEPYEALIDSRRCYDASTTEARELAAVIAFASEVGDLVNAWEADRIKEIRDREAREEQEAQEAHDARNALLKEREEMLLHEFVDERVKVRHHGYKTMCYATCTVRDRGEAYEDDGRYVVKLRYSDQGATRDSGMGSFQRMDVQTDKGWRTLWDDGKDDLPEWDRATKLPQVRPYS